MIRDRSGRILDAPPDATPEEIAEAVRRRDAEDQRNAAALRALEWHLQRELGWD